MNHHRYPIHRSARVDAGGRTVEPSPGDTPFEFDVSAEDGRLTIGFLYAPFYVEPTRTLDVERGTCVIGVNSHRLLSVTLLIPAPASHLKEVGQELRHALMKVFGQLKQNVRIEGPQVSYTIAEQELLGRDSTPPVWMIAALESMRGSSRSSNF